MLPAACHHVLEEVSEETPHRHAHKLHRAHHAQINNGPPRVLIAAVVIDGSLFCISTLWEDLIILASIFADSS